jgi:hypothetical protein
MLIEVPEARELAREFGRSRRLGRTAGGEIAPSEEIGFRDHRGAHRAVLVGALRPGELLVEP